MERDLEQQAPDISDEEDELELVTVTGLLEVRPQEDAGWTLQIRAEDTLAVAEIGGEHAYEDDDDMSVEAFVADFLLPEKGEVEITVAAADAGAKARFERWLAGRRRGAQRYGTAS